MISAKKFKDAIWGHYRDKGRVLAWRKTRDPYRILVSEIMLQQTQVSRVEVFYEKFIKRFPTLTALAEGTTSEVLALWQGLGYNRRALSLQKLAKIASTNLRGRLPRDRAALETLPGIGSYTAGAIRAFAFNEPGVFIETNIRRVFIHFFFTKRKKVHDDEIKVMVEKTLDQENPREWYYALMDYGSMLGKTTKIKNPNRRSAHYAKQSTFSGSDRELRGKILRLMLTKKTISQEAIAGIIPASPQKIAIVTNVLIKEGFLRRTNKSVQLA